MQEDEEEDLREMEGAQRTLNRADFETDEQFQAYKAKREAAPKAAFQFGVKARPSAPRLSAVVSVRPRAGRVERRPCRRWKRADAAASLAWPAHLSGRGVCRCKTAGAIRRR